MNDNERDQLLARLDERSQAQSDKLDEVHEAVKIQNGRVRKLESKASYFKGGIALLTFIIGTLAIFFAGHVWFWSEK